MPNKKTIVDTVKKAAQATGDQEMPARTPLPQRSHADKEATSAARSAGASLMLPHERDQSPDMTSDATQPELAQAARDLKRGIRDTSKGLEMDQAYKKLRK